MRAAYDAVAQAAEAWADLQVPGFAPRVGRLEGATPGFRDVCKKNQIAVHLTGDFPHLTRLDHTAAKEVIDALTQLDWASFGFAQPSQVIPGQICPVAEDEDEDDHAAATSYEVRGAEEAVWGARIAGDDEQESDWVGRRATQSDMEAMLDAELDAYQILLVCLMLWERPAKQWNATLQGIVGDDARILTLMTAFL